jgi:peroxiredoxin Q/BCP
VFVSQDIDDDFGVGSYGCTRQVCQLQALTEKETFKRANVQIVGVSADSAEKQKEFVEKQKLTVSCLV